MKIKGVGTYYVLICDDSKYVMNRDVPAQKLICGVYASMKEAKKNAHDVKDCPCKHTIKRCKVTVEV